MSDSRLQRKKNKNRRKGRTLRIFLYTFLILLLGGGAYGAYIFHEASQAAEKTYKEIDQKKIAPHRTEEIVVRKDPFTILMIGVEGQKGGHRSDVLMLLTVNPETKQVYIASVPRDTRTYIPELGYKDKITHSYAHGVEATIGAVNELLDVPIDYYVSVNFDGFEDVVDSLDGVTVDVPFNFKAQLTGSLKWYNYKKGPMMLNGNQALAYVRMRKSDPRGDIGRIERQKQVIKAIFDKGTDLSSITKIDNVLQDAGENIKTNIPPSELLNFVRLYSELRTSEIHSLTLEGDNDYINRTYYMIPKEESIKEISQTLNNVLKPQVTSATPTPSSTDTGVKTEASGNTNE